MDWLIRKVTGWMGRRSARAIARDPRLRPMVNARIKVDLHGPCTAEVEHDTDLPGDDELARLALHFYCRVQLLLGAQEQPSAGHFQKILLKATQEASQAPFEGSPRVWRRVQGFFSDAIPGPLAEFQASLYGIRIPEPGQEDLRHLVALIPDKFRLAESVIAAVLLVETAFERSKTKVNYRLTTALTDLNFKFQMGGFASLTPESSGWLPNVAYAEAVALVEKLNPWVPQDEQDE